jgi:hypothetical protein
MSTTPPSSLDDSYLVSTDHPAAGQISRWVRHHALGTEFQIDKFVIRHLSVNKRPTGDVGLIRPDVTTFEHGGIDRIINQICHMAQQDANSAREGVQTYGVYAYYKNSDYSPRKFFRVSAEESFDQEEGDGSSSEPATEKGLVSQLMRHLEATMRTTTIHTHTLIETLMRDNQSQRLLIEKQMAQSIDFAAIIQESLDNSTARRIAEKDANTKAEMVGSAFEHLKLLFPVILNKLTGQKIAPETDPSFTLLAALLESLSPEQQQKLITEFLSPAQGAVLAEVIETYDKRKKTLTVPDQQNPSRPTLNLGAMFDKTTDRMKSIDRTAGIDPQITTMEKHAVSFKDAFSRPLPSLGLNIRPADSKK